MRRSLLHTPFCYPVIHTGKNRDKGQAMNKKANTFLFILGATLFNIVVTILSFILLLLLYIKLLFPFLPEEGRVWGFVILFVAAIILTFFIYRFALKLLLKKVQPDKYFDPIFKNRSQKK